MKLNRIDPELRNRYRFIPSIPFPFRPYPFYIYIVFLKLLEKIKPEKKIREITIEHRKLENAGVSIYTPKEKSEACMIYIHGGGFFTGHPLMYKRFCAELTERSKATVIFIDYRLAPKYIFPSALNDCYEVWQWLIAEAVVLGIDTNKIAILGSSAGGCLAASLVQRILNEGGVVQPAAQALLAPMLDDRTALKYELDKIKHRGWNNKNNRYAWKKYLGIHFGQPNTPRHAVPARAKIEDLTGMSPTFISVGRLDLFFEECQQYAECLKKAGVICHLHVAPKAPHNFENMMPEASVSRDFYRALFLFIEEALKINNG